MKKLLFLSTMTLAAALASPAISKVAVPASFFAESVQDKNILSGNIERSREKGLRQLAWGFNMCPITMKAEMWDCGNGKSGNVCYGTGVSRTVTVWLPFTCAN